MRKMIVFAGLMLASVIACTDPYADEVIYELDENEIVTETSQPSSSKSFNSPLAEVLNINTMVLDFSVPEGRDDEGEIPTFQFHLNKLLSSEKIQKKGSDSYKIRYVFESSVNTNAENWFFGSHTKTVVDFKWSPGQDDNTKPYDIDIYPEGFYSIDIYTDPVDGYGTNVVYGDPIEINWNPAHSDINGPHYPIHGKILIHLAKNSGNENLAINSGYEGFDPVVIDNVKFEGTILNMNEATGLTDIKLKVTGDNLPQGLIAHADVKSNGKVVYQGNLVYFEGEYILNAQVPNGHIKAHVHMFGQDWIVIFDN